jgi:hypothetical protein
MFETAIDELFNDPEAREAFNRYLEIRKKDNQ